MILKRTLSSIKGPAAKTGNFTQLLCSLPSCQGDGEVEGKQNRGGRHRRPQEPPGAYLRDPIGPGDSLARAMSESDILGVLGGPYAHACTTKNIVSRRDHPKMTQGCAVEYE